MLSRTYHALELIPGTGTEDLRPRTNHLKLNLIQYGLCVTLIVLLACVICFTKSKITLALKEEISL